MATAAGRCRRACSTSLAVLRRAPRATARYSGPSASMTSSALHPIEPVDPRMAIRFGKAGNYIAGEVRNQNGGADILVWRADILARCLIPPGYTSGRGLNERS